MQIAKRNIQCNLGPTKMVTMLKVGLSFEWLYIRIGIIVVQVSFDLFVAQTLFDIFILTLKHFLLVRQIIPLRVALWLCQKLPKYNEASRAYDRSYLSYTLHVPTTTTYMYLLPTTHCTFSFAKLVNFPGMSTVSKQKNIVFETRPWQDRRQKWVCGRGGVVSFCPTSSSNLLLKSR